MSLLFALLLASMSTETWHTEYPSVLRTGGEYRMWYSAYGTDAAGIEGWRIHYATSEDGIHWTRHGVVLDRGASGSWEASGVAFPSVILRDGEYMMWYGGQSAGKYSIGLARSRDGVHWTRERANPVLFAEPQRHAWESGGVVDPAVVYDAKKRRYVMWFNGIGQQYGYGVATSADGVHWTKHDANPVVSGGEFGAWDESGLYTIAVLEDGGSYRMYYAVGLNGRGASLGTATSNDGIHWTKSAANPLTLTPVTGDDAWNSFGDFYYGAHVIRDGDVWKMWVNAISGANRPYGAIAYATSTDGLTWRKHPESPVLCPAGWPDRR